MKDLSVHPTVAAALGPDEDVRVLARARDAILAVTDRRVIVAAEDRLALAVPYDRLRRIQFDIERARPATMVVVPEHPEDEPQVLALTPDEYEQAATALAFVGQQLARVS